MSEKHAAYLGMVANIDHNVGRLAEYLKKNDLEKNTVIVFINDNGQTEGLDVYNAGMRGCKATVWEGGTRAFSFWKWPEHWKPRTVNNLTAHLDVLPTLCELAKVEIPTDLGAELEGFSLCPLLEADAPMEWHDDRMLYHHVGRWPSGTAAAHKHAMCAVRKGNHLLLRSVPCDDPECKKHQSQCTTLRSVRKGLRKTTYTDDNAQFHWGVSSADGWDLFDVKKDPACQKILTAEKPELVKEMIASYDKWWDEMYPVMMERGGDKGDPTESAKAAARSKAHKAKMDAAANNKAKEAAETP